MAKKTYYDITNLLKTLAEYLILLGQRANGKSYQVKKTCIEDALKGDEMVYLRRWVNDIKVKAVENYFSDMPFKKLTNGKYDGITAWANRLYFYHIDSDTGKRVKDIPCGHYLALNEAERYKSWAVFDKVTNIIFEEFITDKTYLDDEPTILQQLISTIARLRKVRVFLIGNTLSRVCPYFSEWCLDGVLKQKQGTIDIYHYHTTDNAVINIAVEYCQNTQNDNLMFFGQAEKQIVTGEWDVREVPHLPRKGFEYDVLYEVLVIYQSFSFLLQLLYCRNTGGVITFVHPHTTKRKVNRVITDKMSDDIFSNNHLRRDNRAECKIIECFNNNKVCYSTNLCGADFKHVLDAFPIV